MPRAQRNEVSYYPEIMAFVKTQIESNFLAARNPLRVYCKTGELRHGLLEIIAENNINTESIIRFAEQTPPLNLDIFALITDGIKYELLIIEVKLLESVGLTQLSQLIGYSIVSNAQYGLLINVNGDISARLTDIIMHEPDVTNIKRELSNHQIVFHRFGVMEWDSNTQNLLYSGYGGIRTLSELCRKLAEEFEIDQ